MTPQEFCYWLQGFMEMEQPKRLTAEQTRMVKAHLQLVFHNVTDEQREKFRDTRHVPSENWPPELRKFLPMQSDVFC